MKKYLVAESYKNYTQIGEPYTKDSGKQYIRLSKPCSKCGGTGIYLHFGTCFTCNGSGKNYAEARVYTPEEYEKYTASLERRREKRLEEQEKKEFELLSNSEINKKEVMVKLGFDPETALTYIPVGDTYAIKDTLKANGYKYNPVIGWHNSIPSVEKINHVSISFDKLYDWYPLTKYAELRPEAEGLVKSSLPSIGEHYGEIGKRFKQVRARLDERKLVCDGTCYLYKFTADNYTFIWLTSSSPKVKYTNEEPIEGATYLLTATVKGHEVSNGIKTTKVNRAVLEK